MWQILFDYILLVYCAAQLVLLIALEHLSRHRLPKDLWWWVKVQVAIVIILTSIDLVPYLLLGYLLPPPVARWKNMATLIILAGILVQYVSLFWKWVCGRWSRSDLG